MRAKIREEGSVHLAQSQHEELFPRSRREGVPPSAENGPLQQTARRRGWVITLELARRQSTISQMRRKALPQFVEPMQASSVKEPFDSPDWIFETKLDGYRAIAVIDSAGKARIWSRNQLPFEPKFPMVLDAVDQLNLRSTILDGEIVALDPEGIPRFQLLQQWQKRPTAPVVFYLFDVLWSDGRDLTGKTVLQCRDRLEHGRVAVRTASTRHRAKTLIGLTGCPGAFAGGLVRLEPVG